MNTFLFFSQEPEIPEELAEATKPVKSRTGGRTGFIASLAGIKPFSFSRLPDPAAASAAWLTLQISVTKKGHHRIFIGKQFIKIILTQLLYLIGLMLFSVSP